MNHGHVTKNKDGSTARCGGPTICSECALELASHKPDGNIHGMPTNGPKHIESKDCWCEPVMTFKDKHEVWLHKGYEELNN
jgi:hypothetical protein